MLSTSRPAALASGAASGATIGRLLGIGAMGTLLGLAAGVYVAYVLSTPTPPGSGVVIASPLQLGDRKPAFRTTDPLRPIAMNSDYEVRAWCDELGCSFQQLRRAVAAVGPSVENVCAYLTER